MNDEKIIRDVESFFKLAKNAYSSYRFAYKENKPLLLKTLVSNYSVSGNKAKVIFEPKIDEIYKTWCTRQDVVQTEQLNKLIDELIHLCQLRVV